MKIQSILKMPRFLAALLLCASFTVQSHSVAAEDLEFLLSTGEERAVESNAIVVMGKKDAVLIDAHWLLPDGEKLAQQIADSGRDLKYVLITHGHPDHHGGLERVLARFPRAKVLAREGVRDEMVYDFLAKRIHWLPMLGDDLAVKAVDPEIFTGHSIMLEGHEIRFIDLPPAETVEGTAFYIPSMKTLIGGDLIFAGIHPYLAEHFAMRSWIGALQMLQGIGPIERVYPGHGQPGGPELIDNLIAYLEDYDNVFHPNITIPEVASKMAAAYPDWGLPIILWWTRGPGFGVFGPEALGMPEGIVATLPMEK